MKPKKQSPERNENFPIDTQAKKGVEFLISEYSQLGELWKHTDSRIDTTINFYITICAIVVPGSVLIFQVVKDINIFILTMLPVALIFFAAGIFFTENITLTDVHKSQYVLAQQLIRRYFVDNEPGISKYVYMEMATPSDDLEEKLIQLHPYFHKTIILSVNVINSLLIGIIISSIIWLLAPTNLYILVLVGLFLALLSISLLTIRYNRKIASFRETIKNRYRSHER